MQLSLACRTYLVTGGGSGIGMGVAATLVEAGGNVLIAGRSLEKLQTAADGIEAAVGSGAVKFVTADVTKEEEAQEAVEVAAAWTGRLHGVVHCAGGTRTLGPITQVDSEGWRETVDLNVNGTMYVLKHAARHMVRDGGGSFVGISSIAASNTHRWFGAYGPSKAALDHLLKLAADELGPSWVRVNGIRPGLTRTEMVAPVMELAPLAEDYRLSTPLPRVGEVDDIANLALFLLSDAAGWITGQIINVDGGQMLRRGPDYSSLVGPMFGEDALRGIVN